MNLEKVKKINKQKKVKLFKYLKSYHLENVLNNGEILFRNLTYFKEYEDGKKRGDNLEGSIFNNPTDGFIIENITQGNTSYANSTRNTIDADNLFVFCLSKKHDKALYKEFESDCCIEITNVQEFTRRLGKSLKFMEYDYGDIEYYNTNSDTNFNMIKPCKIPFYKDDFFKKQDEYRYWFSETPPETLIQVDLVPHDENKIKGGFGLKKEQNTPIGSIKDIAKVHWLKEL